jgi:hypothetical protein
MKLKDLSSVWSNGTNFATLHLPFVTYLVEPHWGNQFNEDSKKFVASFKGYIVIHEAMSFS